MYKEFNDYYIKEMNNDSDIFNLLNELSTSIEAYSDRIDMDNILGILIGLCKMVGDVKGLKGKEFRRGLKHIIDQRLEI